MERGRAGLPVNEWESRSPHGGVWSSSHDRSLRPKRCMGRTECWP